MKALLEEMESFAREKENDFGPSERSELQLELMAQRSERNERHVKEMLKALQEVSVRLSGMERKLERRA